MPVMTILSAGGCAGIAGGVGVCGVADSMPMASTPAAAAIGRFGIHTSRA
jgi:hypothetical protein